ncbi:MAG: hypothetical protein K0R92_617 [Lachnospiraceae bacterium]|jgi:hypothetical protein|nr:hypothetical protein [Lachnospiraceae bacterium]
MEKVISILYDIEEKANNIIKRVNEEKVRLQEELNQDLEKLDQTIANEKAEKLNVLKADIDKKLAVEKQSLIDDCNKQLDNMEENYGKNHDALVKNIFQELIKA